MDYKLSDGHAAHDSDNEDYFDVDDQYYADLTGGKPRVNFHTQEIMTFAPNQDKIHTGTELETHVQKFHPFDNNNHCDDANLDVSLLAVELAHNPKQTATEFATCSMFHASHEDRSRSLPFWMRNTEDDVTDDVSYSDMVNPSPQFETENSGRGLLCLPIGNGMNAERTAKTDQLRDILPSDDEPLYLDHAYNTSTPIDVGSTHQNEDDTPILKSKQSTDRTPVVHHSSLVPDGPSVRSVPSDPIHRSITCSTASYSPANSSPSTLHHKSFKFSIGSAHSTGETFPNSKNLKALNNWVASRKNKRKHLLRTSSQQSGATNFASSPPVIMRAPSAPTEFFQRKTDISNSPLQLSRNTSSHGSRANSCSQLSSSIPTKLRRTPSALKRSGVLDSPECDLSLVRPHSVRRICPQGASTMRPIVRRALAHQVAIPMDRLNVSGPAQTVIAIASAAISSSQMKRTRSEK